MKSANTGSKIIYNVYIDRYTYIYIYIYIQATANIHILFAGLDRQALDLCMLQLQVKVIFSVWNNMNIFKSRRQGPKRLDCFTPCLARSQSGVLRRVITRQAISPRNVFYFDELFIHGCTRSFHFDYARRCHKNNLIKMTTFLFQCLVCGQTRQRLAAFRWIMQ